MKEITIGLLDQDWKPTIAARYYAERGSGGEYAFGPTPTEALERLEARERAIRLNSDECLAEEAAFLALGAADFLKDRRIHDLEAHGGFMGFIGEVVRHAPLLAEHWARVRDEGFGGVWLYDVTERFGREWAEIVYSGSNENPADRLKSIIENEMAGDSCADPMSTGY